jgi:hypothetical protein
MKNRPPQCSRTRRSPGAPAIAGAPKDCYGAAMEALFGDPSYKGFVLQDRKRLPARFFARVFGAVVARLS